MNHPITHTIDAARIAAVVREVIARIQNQTIQTIPSKATGTRIPDKVVTIATLDALPSCPGQILIEAKAIVTPAARDEAKLRGITIERSSEQPAKQIPEPAKTAAHQELVDNTNPERATTVLAQLSRRGVNMIGSKIVLSETPAADVFRFCSGEKERAVMLTSISEIARFASELKPTVWVFDMQRMNLMTAVNAAVQIAQKS